MSDNKQLQESMKRALSAIRDHQVGKVLGDMRKDIAGPEERVVDFVCACSGAPFHVRFTRPSPAERFTIAGIERGGQPRQEPQPSSFWTAGKATASRASFDVAEFDMSGWSCPWCQAAKGIVPFTFVHCGSCDDLVCTGRTSMLPNGRSWFVCHDRCGTQGMTRGTLKRMDGQEPRSRKGLPAANEKSKLSGTTTPRLPWQRR